MNPAAVSPAAPAAAAMPDLLDRAASMGWLGRRMDWRAREDRGAARGGALAGLPFLAKDLFDIAGEPTVAASPTRLDAPPASQDAALVSDLCDEGAVLLGTTNMDSLAYGFVTSTRLYGTARNPHDPARICGGSSGGSAAAVAAGIVPFALGTDTSGSIRVPSALCGVPGLKPSRGRLSLRGTVPLAPSLDHAGFFADSVDRLETLYRILAGPFEQPGELRFGLLGGYYAQGLQPSIAMAIADAARSVAAQTLPCPGEQARAAAYITVAAEAARTHSGDLLTQRERFDPAVRDRLTAGLLVPQQWLDEAAQAARHYALLFERLFQRVDILLAPAVPCTAPPADDAMANLPGTAMPLRAALGLYTQPLSLTGLPVLTLPLESGEGLPTAIQIIAPMNCEARLFAAARMIEQACPAASNSAFSPINQNWRPS